MSVWKPREICSVSFDWICCTVYNTDTKMISFLFLLFFVFAVFSGTKRVQLQTMLKAKATLTSSKFVFTISQYIYL